MVPWKMLMAVRWEAQVEKVFQRPLAEGIPITVIKMHCKLHSTKINKDMYTNVLEKAMAPHSSTLAWKIPWMEGPSGLQSMGLLRVRHDRATSFSLFTFTQGRQRAQLWASLL